MSTISDKPPVALPQELLFQNYTPIPRINLQTVVDNWPEDQVVTWENQVKETIEHNRTVYLHNQEIIDRWLSIFKATGHNPIGSRGGVASWYKEALTALGKPTGIPVSCASDCYSNQTVVLAGQRYDSPMKITGHSPYTLLEVVQKARGIIQHAMETAQKNKTLEARLLGLAPSLNINPSAFSSTSDFLSAISGAAKTRWVESNYPTGTAMDFDGCEYCSEWAVGERRCSCGNRRVSLCVDGDPVIGFHAYPEPH